MFGSVCWKEYTFWFQVLLKFLKKASESVRTDGFSCPLKSESTQENIYKRAKVINRRCIQNDLYFVSDGFGKRRDTQNSFI